MVTKTPRRLRAIHFRSPRRWRIVWRSFSLTTLAASLSYGHCHGCHMDRESLSEILFRRVYHRNATVALSSAVSSQTDATRLQSKTHPAHTPSYRYKLCAQRTFGRLLVRTSQLETNSHCHFRLLISGLSSALSAGTPRTIVTNELQFVTQLIPPPSSFDSWRRLNSITSEPPLLCLKTSPNSGSKAEKASGTSEIPIQNELRTFSETLCSTEAITRQISRQFLPFSVKTFTVGVSPISYHG